jgi:hypothetical protein
MYMDMWRQSKLWLGYFPRYGTWNLRWTHHLQPENRIITQIQWVFNFPKMNETMSASDFKPNFLILEKQIYGNMWHVNMSIPSWNLFNQWTGVHETWHEHHATGGHPTSEHSNSLGRYGKTAPKHLYRSKTT